MRRWSRKNFITFLCLIYNRHPLSMINEDWRWRDGDWRNQRGTTNTRTNSPWPLIWKKLKILEPHLIYFPYSFWNRHWRFDILKLTNKNNPSKYTFGLFFDTQTLHLEQALIQVWNPWRVRRGSVTIHTLFFFELYFGSYLIGTTISWSLDHIFWSYLLILSLDHISWSYLIWQMILSDRWSYLTDDLIWQMILSDRWSYLTDDLIWQMILCFFTFLQHVLDAYFGYYLHALDMCYTQLMHATHFWCCASHACSMLYLWLTHVCPAAYMLTLLYKPSIDDCTL